MNAKYARLFLSLPIWPMVTGCSVVMALSGSHEPEFQLFEVGITTRIEIEQQLGKPVSRHELPNGDREDTYRFEIGNAPDLVRAVQNMFKDVLSLFLAEPFQMRREMQRGHQEESVVLYSANDRVKEIRGYRSEMTANQPSALEQAEAEQRKAIQSKQFEEEGQPLRLKQR